MFLILTLVLLILSFGFYLFIINWKARPWPSSFQLPLYQIHRGYWREGIQENTMQAFKEAKLRGAPMIEFDLIPAKNKRPVVFHDFDLNRLGGRTDLVADLELQQIKQWANAPSLEELLISKDVPEFLNLEIKSNAKLDDGFEREIYEVIKKTGQEHRVLFSSFNPFALRRMAKLFPNNVMALLVTAQKNDPDASIYLRKFWLGGLAKAHLLHLDNAMVTSELVADLKKRKIPFAVWTVNDKKRAEELRQFGALSLITDLEKV